MRALCTGSSGFLGRYLCPELERRGWEVNKINSKTGNHEWPKEKYDAIFHLAAETRAGDYCLTHAGNQWLANQEINLHALRWWYLHSPDAKLITIGSSCAYAPGSNLKEDDYMKGEPHESLYTYAMTKRMLYEGCRALNKQFGMKYLYLVPSTLYGPDYHTDGRQAHFIFDLIKKIIRGKELGEPVILWGDGYQTRDVIHVRDFVKIMLELNDKEENDIFNISSHCGDIRQYANLICDVVGYEFEDVKYNISGHVGANIKTLDTHKMEDICPGADNVIKIEDGIKEVVDWYYANGGWK